MHEAGIALQILQMARDAAGEGEFRLTKVAVAVGELSSLDPDLLTFAWQGAIADTPDVGCKLLVEWHPCERFCPTCDTAKPKGEGAGWMEPCPDCGDPLRVTGGTELDLLRVEFVPAE